MRPRLALIVAIGAGLAALAPGGCSLDAFCREGEPGCAVDACADAIRDGDETDVDCGGSCAPCMEGAACLAPADCDGGLCVAGACCAPPCVLAAATLGGPGADQATAAAALPDGRVLVVGEVGPGADLPGAPPEQGGTDVFVAAWDPDGSPAWLRRIGSPNDELAARVVAHPDGRSWIVGTFGGDALDMGVAVLPGSGGFGDLFWLELDAAGAPLRAQAWSSHGTFVDLGAFVRMPDGGAVLAGQLGTIDFGGAMQLTTSNPERQDVFVARLDAAGQPVWARRFGGRDNEFLVGLGVTQAGAVLLGLNYTDETDLHEATVPPGVVGEGYALALAELDPGSGEVRWARGYGSWTFSVGLAMAPDGDVLVVGNFEDDADIGLGRLQARATGGGDAFVARFAGDGTPRWLVPFPAIGSLGRSVIVTPDGSALAAIEVAGDLSFEGGIQVPTTVDGLVLARIDPTGRVVWARSGGGIVVNRDVGLAPTPDGAVAFGGFAGTLELGEPRASRGKTDAFLAHFVP